MKSRIIKVAMLPALVLASSAVIFAGDQTAIHKYVPYDPTDVSKVAVQEKGHVSPAPTEVRAKAYREQTAQDSTLRKQEAPVQPHEKYWDPAFRK